LVPQGHFVVYGLTMETAAHVFQAAFDRDQQ